MYNNIIITIYINISMHKIYTARGAPLPPAVLGAMCSRRADRAGSGLILTAVSFVRCCLRIGSISELFINRLILGLLLGIILIPIACLKKFIFRR